MTQSDCQRDKVVLPGAASPLGGGQVVGQCCVHPAAVTTLTDRVGPVRRAPKTPYLCFHSAIDDVDSCKAHVVPLVHQKTDAAARSTDLLTDPQTAGTTHSWLFAADLRLRKLEGLFRLGSTSAIPDGDGKGYLGQTGQTGLVLVGGSAVLCHRRRQAAAYPPGDDPRRTTMARPPVGGQPNMQQLMKQAQKMQAQMAVAQEQLAATELTGTAGGGLVTATVSGAGEVLGVKIDVKAVDPDDVESLEDLVLAAVRDGQRQAGELGQQTMGPMTSGLPGF